jgi:hypothetical protein
MKNDPLLDNFSFYFHGSIEKKFQKGKPIIFQLVKNNFLAFVIF